MGRFDVYATPSRGGTGYVLDVQADLLHDLATRVVVPLLPPEAAPKPARGLNPAFEIDGQPHLMLTQFIAAVLAKELRNPLLCVDARSDEIMRALDMLLIGF
jgi:toxin CcdB